MSHTEKRFHTGEIEINYAEWSGEGPPLLFIHGITSDWTAWEGIAPAFVADWHCYAIDLRGHGKSGHAEGGYHWDEYASDAAALIRDVIGAPAFVVGHSLGAATAVGVASAIPDLVKAVVYEDPPMFVRDRRTNEAKNRFGWRLELIESGMTIDEMTQNIVKTTGDDPEVAKRQAVRWSRMDAEVLRSSINRTATRGWDVEGQLRRASPAGLLLQANPELGGVLTDDEAQRTLGLLPNVVHERWEDSGHGMHAQFPERFVKSVRSFFGDQLSK